MTLTIIFIMVGLAFAVAGLMGAPYLPIRSADTEPLLKLANLEPGQTLLDLGSGDGRLLRAAAALKVHAIGYELNPILVVISQLLSWRQRRLVEVHIADFWQQKLPAADVIYVFLIPRYMSRLHRRLSSQITRPTRVISYAFEIPGAKLLTRNHNTFVYQYGEHEKSPELEPRP